MTNPAGTVVTNTSDPEVTSNSSGASWYSSALQIVAIAMLLLSIVIGYGRWRTGSFGLVWPWLSGNQLLFKRTNIELGDVAANVVIDEQLEVRNLSSTPLTILGAQVSCRCVRLDSFPIKVAAGEHQILRVRIESGAKPGRISHSVKYFLDGDMCSSVIVSVTGTVR
ncbi:MAG: DUF1573 domain-containing protein [Planctomycetales bacterium]|nr:DUF1573 domain-containing protein [Planctomycetales bacterium]